MTENQEGLDPNVGENSDGKQGFSQAGDGQLSEQQNQNVAISQQEYQELVAQIRGLQSKMDKDADAIEKRMEDKFLSKVERLGLELSPEQKREYQLMQLAEKVDNLASRDVKTDANVSNTHTTVEVAEVFKALNITEPTPDQAKLALQHANDPISLTKALVERQFNKPIPDATTAVVSGQVSSGAALSTESELLREFNNLQGLHQDLKLDTGKTVRQRRDEITAELEALEQKT